MDKRETLIKEIKKFTKIISKEYKIKKVILFGSQVTKKININSDVDLIIVSPNFKRKRKIKRSPPLYIKWNLSYPVDFLCYTPEEFKKKKSQIGIVQEAVKEGIEII